MAQTKTEIYSKKEWKKLNDVPTETLGKQNTYNSEIEYSIENKYIKGSGKEKLEELSGLEYYRKVEFQGTNIFCILKNLI